MVAIIHTDFIRKHPAQAVLTVLRVEGVVVREAGQESVGFDLSSARGLKRGWM